MATSKRKTPDLAAIRKGLQGLPPTPHHGPGDPVLPQQMLVVQQHQRALDPERALVVGNRGAGKSFWAHALADPVVRKELAKTFRELAALDVAIGFNASGRLSRPSEGAIAPNLIEVDAALDAKHGPESVWRCVWLRAAVYHGVPAPSGYPLGNFPQEVAWVSSHGVLVSDLLTIFDDKQKKAKRKFILVFDALDRLGRSWEDRRTLLQALMKLAMEARSFHALRVKAFLRADQYADSRIFQFPDGSKIKNDRVTLEWQASELYELLFWHLGASDSSRSAMHQLRSALAPQGATVDDEDGQRALVHAIAGEFMGSSKKRGRVYTWVPTHLADARGETSPRTFLTAWRSAAEHTPAPQRLAVDHFGLQAGVVAASEARRSELEQDYWWLPEALAPLSDAFVPLPRREVQQLWRRAKTADGIFEGVKRGGAEQRVLPIFLETARQYNTSLEDALFSDLEAIGVFELRPGDNINVPDIYRLQADIKRRGGVPRPKR